MSTLLNWDGTFNADDMIENIRSIVSRFTGWTYLRIYVDDKKCLHIESRDGRDGRVQQLLVFNLVTKVEHYGRINHVGLNRYVDELKLLA